MSSQGLWAPLFRIAASLGLGPAPRLPRADAARERSAQPSPRSRADRFGEAIRRAMPDEGAGPWLIAGATILLGTQALLLAGDGRPRSFASVSHVIQIVLGMVAVAACSRAAARSRSFPRRVWWWVALAAGIHTAGQAVWTFCDTFGSQPFFSPWASDQFLFFWVVPLVIATVADPLEPRRRLPVTTLLDIVQVLLLALAWHYAVFGDAAAWQQDGPGMDYLEWKVRVGRDLFVLGCLVVRAVVSEFEVSRHLFRRVAGFFAAFACIDLAYLYLESRAGLMPGTMMDLGWSLPRWLLVFLAVTWSTSEGQWEVDRSFPRRRHVLLHIASMVVPMVILVLLAQTMPTSGFMQSLLGAAIACAGWRVLITQARQERAVRELTRSRNVLSAVVEGTSQPIYLKSLQGKYRLVNSAFAAALGRKPSEVLGRTDEEVLAPEFLAQIRMGDRRVMSSQQPDAEEVFLESGGERRTLLSTKSPYLEPDGRMTGILGMAVDITAVKETQTELLHWKSRCDGALKASGQVMYEFIPENGKLRIDINVETFLGYSKEELPGHVSGWRQLIHTEDIGTCDEVMGRAIRDRQPFRCEYRVMAKAGGYRHVVEHGQVFAGTAGRPYRILGFFQDVTELRRTQDQLKSAQRLESLGTLAAGIAHDFNNLLTVIHGYSEMLLESRQRDVNEAASSIHQSAERAAALVRQLLAFSRQQQLSPRVLNLTQSVSGVYKILRRLIPENVEMRLQLEREVHSVLADPGQVEQIIINLAVNARDAMPNGGALTLTTSNCSVTASNSSSLGVPTGDYVVLSVEDTGLGMTPEVLARIFEPFFTTKAIGRGTGLGLATVHGIVTQSGGHIRVESEVGRGTTFEIFLPKVRGKSQEVMPMSSILKRARGQESILLVEDDPNVRELVANALCSAGFAVTGVDDPRLALQMAKRQGDRIDLLVADLLLPGMDGHELSQKIREVSPETKVMFMTGHIEGEVFEQVVSERSPVLQKPFSSGRLLDTVRRTLDA